MKMNLRGGLTWEDVKQALISILVGAAISALTIILQGLLDLLQSIPPEGPGAIAGVGRQVAVWLTSRHG